MRGVFSAVIGAATLAAILGCGGVWDQASSQAISEQASELRGKLLDVEESPEREAVDQILQDIQQDPAGIGVVDIGVFAAHVEQAISDGTIEDAEVSELQARHAEQRAP